MSFAQTAGDFTITSSASTSNVIDGGGRTLAGLIFPASGWTGTGFSIKEALDSSASNQMAVYDSSAGAIAVTTPASASAAIMVKLDPTKYHTMQFMQLNASSAQSSAIIVKPVWTRYNAKG